MGAVNRELAPRLGNQGLEKEMDELKRAVENALELYAETSGMTLQEVGKRFEQSAACRENIFFLVAAQAAGSPYAI
jgi:hypothetical protein